MEKKLTDEEIVKALEDEKEFLLREEKRTGNAPDTQLLYIRGEVVLKILDIIHRLQDENGKQKAEIEELKEDNEQWETLYHIGEERKYRKMFVEEWKKEYQKELDKQGEGLIAGSPDFDYVYELYFKQKAEIERLTEENVGLKEQVDEYFKKAYFYYQKCKAYGIENFYDDELEPKPAKGGKTLVFPKFKGDDEVE